MKLIQKILRKIDVDLKKNMKKIMRKNKMKTSEISIKPPENRLQKPNDYRKIYRENNIRMQRWFY